MSIDSVLSTFNKAVDMVVAEPPGPKRWRAANTLWLSLSPKNRAEYEAVVTENKKVREAIDKHGFAKGNAGKSEHTLRNALTFPRGAYMFISKADPQAFLEKENAAKMNKTFPEYLTREVI
jgi:hypothetical protein